MTSEARGRDPFIRQALGHYRIIQRLGGGRTGVVYKPEDARLQRFAALIRRVYGPLGLCDGLCRWRCHLAAILIMASFAELSSAQNLLPNGPKPGETSQINVNWLYGSYVPKEVPIEPLNADLRFKLYLRSTYTAPGIYIKTILFALRDQAHNTYPEWGDGIEGFGKRLGSRQAQFIIRNSVTSLGNGLLGWEPRYDRCRCTGFWPRTKHAIVRNFVTYDRTEKSLRPQLFPYVGAFTGSVTATTWEPGSNRWEVKGYQAVITQIPVGMGMNWIDEFTPEIARVLHKHK